MEPTNPNWTPTDKGFCTEASDLAISPGLHPANSYEARDPWNRELPHNTVVWTSHKNGDNETTHWTTTVRAPGNGKAVVLQVFND